jgi:hypothetical protein
MGWFLCFLSLLDLLLALVAPSDPDARRFFNGPSSVLHTQSGVVFLPVCVLLSRILAALIGQLIARPSQTRSIKVPVPRPPPQHIVINP